MRWTFSSSVCLKTKILRMDGLLKNDVYALIYPKMGQSKRNSTFVLADCEQILFPHCVCNQKHLIKTCIKCRRSWNILSLEAWMFPCLRASEQHHERQIRYNTNDRQTVRELDAQTDDTRVPCGLLARLQLHTVT